MKSKMNEKRTGHPNTILTMYPTKKYIHPSLNVYNKEIDYRIAQNERSRGDI
jgi:hypothetical protein